MKKRSMKDRMLLPVTIGVIGMMAVALIYSIITSSEKENFGPYSACYAFQANEEWAVFITHWEYGEIAFSLNMNDSTMMPNLIIEADSNVVGQWEYISNNTSYVAIAQQRETPLSNLVIVYDMQKERKVAEYETRGAAPRVVEFNSEELIFFDTDGDESTLLWRIVDTNDWSLVESLDYNQTWPSPHNNPTEEQRAEVERRVLFCESWPGEAVVETATPEPEIFVSFYNCGDDDANICLQVEGPNSSAIEATCRVRVVTITGEEVIGWENNCAILRQTGHIEFLIDEFSGGGQFQAEAVYLQLRTEGGWEAAQNIPLPELVIP